jgi:hypothetical protein
MGGMPNSPPEVKQLPHKAGHIRRGMRKRINRRTTESRKVRGMPGRTGQEACPIKLKQIRVTGKEM